MTNAKGSKKTVNWSGCADSLTPNLVKAVRTRLNWTQEELAKQAGTFYSTVLDFEQGRRDPTSAKRLQIFFAFSRAGVRFVREKDAVVGFHLTQTALRLIHR